MLDRTEKLESLTIERGAQTSRNRTAWWASGVAAFPLAIIGIWHFGFQSSESNRSLSDVGAATTVATLEPASVRLSTPETSGLVASGYVVARRSATVSADITGPLTEVLFEEGAEVEAGQVLARIDSKLAWHDLNLALARVDTAQAAAAAVAAEIEAARSQRTRYEQLISSGAVSHAALDAAVAEHEALVARLSAAGADVRLAETAVARQREYLARHEIKAPFQGVVIAKNAQAGEILSPISAGGAFTRTGIATLVDMGSLEVEVDVNESQIAQINPGQRAKVVLDAYPDWEIPGTTIAIVPTANRERATIVVRVGINRVDARILPEMATKVTFERREG